MKTELDISKLIEKAQDLAHDGMMEMAAEGEKPVQIMESDNGGKYQLSVKMKLIEKSNVHPVFESIISSIFPHSK